VRKKPVYINESGLVRCGMCSTKAKKQVYLDPSKFTEGMLDSARFAHTTGRGRCIACIQCFKAKQIKEFKRKAAKGSIKPEYAYHDTTFGHPKPGDELYRQFVFSKPIFII
jgi:hypothetical protein